MVKTVLAVKIEEEDFKTLKQFCKGNGIEVSDFVRAIIAEHVKELKHLESLNIPLFQLGMLGAFAAQMAEDHRFTFNLLGRILDKLGDYVGAEMAKKAEQDIKEHKEILSRGSERILKAAGLIEDSEKGFSYELPK